MLSEKINELWKDARKFQSAFSEMDNSPESWERCAVEVNQLYIKHGKTKFAFALLSAVYDELARSVGAKENDHE